MELAGILCFKVQVILDSVTRTRTRTRTLVSALLLFLISFLPFSAIHLIPVLRTFFLILAPQLWQGLMQWLTQPVLFLFLNIVIVSIWIISTTSSHVACERQLNDEKLTSLGSAAAPEELPQILVSGDASIEPPTPAEENPSPILRKIKMPDECQSIDPLYTFPAEEKERDAESSQPAAPKDLPNLKSVERQVSAPEKRPKVKAKSITRPNSQKSHQKHKCTSYPQAPASVIVKDFSIAEEMDAESPSGRREATVIHKDELNERIEAFFAKFREQLRLQSQEFCG